jgi:hypothetical protein
LRHAHSLARTEHSDVLRCGDEFHKLSFLNDQLSSKTNRVYAETYKATMSSVLQLRNQYGHGQGDDMSVETRDV